MHRRTLLLLLVSSGLVIGLPLSASAQINPFRGSRGTQLTTADLTALNEATQHLLDQAHLTAGAKASWNNAKSGVAGTVTAANPVQRHGLACRMTNYLISGPGSEPNRKATLTWCKTKDGWKIG
jgi:surface antigen